MISIRNLEATEHKSAVADLEIKTRQQHEEILSLRRDLALKKGQMTQMEQSSYQVSKELDAFRYKVQEGNKLNMELKLKVDLLDSTIDGLKS